MSESSSNASLGGYDEEFVNTLEDDLQCAICQLPLKDPMLTKCGHRFCRQCLDGHFRSLELAGERFICPVDRNNLMRNRDIFPDKATERKILSFFVKCPSEGCQWTGELRSKDSHLDSCPLKVVFCTNEDCYETLTRNNLQEHVTTTCPWRILRCEHCNVSHLAYETEAHELECDQKPINCPRNCGTVIPREEFSAHDETDCPLALTSCPYAQMGCTTEVQRKEIEIHLQTAVGLHLDFACVKLNSTQVELTSTQAELKRSQETTRNLDEKVNALVNQLQLTEEKVNDFQSQLETTKEELEDRVETMEMFFKDNNEKVDSLQRKLELSLRRREERQNVDKDMGKTVNVLQKEEICLEIDCNVWSKDWKIPGISEILTNKSMIDSNPFYVGENGYKCKLRLDVKAGRNEVRSFYVFKLYIEIIEGKNDDVLLWPFHKKVTYSLFGQEESICKVDSITVNCFKSYVADEKATLAFKLVSWRLDSRKASTCKFFVNDTMFIQVKISPP